MHSAGWVKIAVLAAIGAVTVISIQAQNVASGYSPSQTTVGYLPESNLVVSLSIPATALTQGFGYRAYWGGNASAGGVRIPIQSFDLVGEFTLRFVVEISPALRVQPTQQPLTICGTVFIPPGIIRDNTCTDWNLSNKFIVNPTPTISTQSPLSIGGLGAPYSVQLAAAGGTPQNTPTYSWSVQSGSLPPNFSLNPSTGLLTGSPSGYGTFNFSVLAADSLGVGQPKAFTLTIQPRAVLQYNPSATTAGASPQSDLTVSLQLQNMPVGGTNLKAFWNNTQSPLNVTQYNGTSMSVAVPTALRSTPGEHVIIACATIPGTQFEVCTDPQQSAKITVNPSPRILTTPGALPDAVQGTSYAFSFNAVGGTGSLSWTIASGTLPTGIQLSLSAGSLTGSTFQTGVFPITVRVSDSLGVSASAEYSLTVRTVLRTVSAYSPAATTVGYLPGSGLLVSLTLQNMPTGAVSQTRALWVAPGSSAQTQIPLIAYLGTAARVEIPDSLRKAPGSAKFIVCATPQAPNAIELCTSPPESAAFVLNPTPGISSGSSLPSAVPGVAYSHQIAASGGTGPLTWALQSASVLPPELTLNASSGVISGIPRTSGQFAFAVMITDTLGVSASKSFTLSVTSALSISTPAALPGGTVGVPYTASISAAGGLPPYLFALSSAAALPQGLTIFSSGAITGTPQSPGTFSFAVSVQDSSQATTVKTFTLEIAPTPPSELRILTQSVLPDGSTGIPYELQIIVEGGTAPYSFQIESGNLPQDLILSPTGRLSGTPQTPSQSTFTIRVTDAGSPSRTLVQSFTLRITGTISISPSALPSGRVLQAYTVSLSASGGSGGYVFSLAAGSLPPGLSLSANGTISGEPTAAGTYPFIVQVADSQSVSAQRSFSMLIEDQSIGGVEVSLQSTSPPGNSQQQAGVSLSTAQPAALDGKLRLKFSSAVPSVSDDPAIQFIAGGREASFQIAAGQTAANFSGTAFALYQTGTVAGTITLEAELRRNNLDVTPVPKPTATVTIPLAPPVITNLTVTRTSAGLRVVVRGYSTPRSMSAATITFTARPGASISGGLSFSVGEIPAKFTTWYNDGASAGFGSQFQLTLDVMITGEPADIIGLSMQLQNSSGQSNSVSASF